MSLSCYNSSESVAVNASVLYDDNNNSGDFWNRRSLNVPLLSCSSSSPPPDSHCLVCLFDQVVYAVCRNLTDGVKMMMEAGADQVQISKSECPRLLVDATNENGDSSGNHGDAWKWWLPVLLAVLGVLAVVMIVLLVVFCKRRKCERSPKTLKECWAMVAAHCQDCPLGGFSQTQVTDAVDSSEVEPVAEAEAEV